MAQLENNPAVDTVTLGSLIVDDMVAENETNPIGGSSTLALIDETAVPLLYSTWVDFAYENEDALLKKNYSQETEEHGRVAYKTSTAKAVAAESAMSTRSESIPSKRGFFDELLFGGPSYTIDGSYDWTSENAVTISDYFITDIMAVAGSIDSDTSRALASALDTAIAHYGCTEDESVAMTGIAVTLPYGDAEFYDEMSLVFSNCGFDEEYIAWLENFVDASGSDTYYNYDEFIDEWIGWDYYYDSYDWNNWYYEDSEGWDDQYDSGYGWYDDYTYDYGWYDYGPAGGYDSHWDWWF